MVQQILNCCRGQFSQATEMPSKNAAKLKYSVKSLLVQKPAAESIRFFLWAQRFGLFLEPYKASYKK